MPITAPSIDPLARYLNSELTQGHRQRIPLVATHIDVIIRGGLAVVATERTFRNVENKSIEATLTFPVPVDATLCALAARIDGRVLSAMAQAREEARASYESALDAGKGAILHEELLKGIHMRDRGDGHLDRVFVLRCRLPGSAHPDDGRRDLRTVAACSI